MIHKRSVYLILVSWLIAVLTACGSSGGLQQGTSLPSTDTSTSEYTATSSLNSSSKTLLPVTPTVKPSPTAILPTPALPEWVFGDFLFGNQTPNCEFPRWQGLRIDQSTGDDVQRMFDTEFAFNGTKDFAMNYPNSDYFWKSESAFGRSHQWVFAKEPLQQLTIGTWLNKDSYELQAIDFRWTSLRNIADTSPKRLIESLGPPTHFLARVELTEIASKGNLVISMLFDIGVFYGVEQHISIIELNDTYVAEYCAGNTDIDWSQGSILIMEPFPNNLDNMTPVQKELLGNPYERSAPVDNLFGLSIKDISEKILSGECVYSRPLLPSN